MSLRPRTIRVSDRAWELFTQEAEHEGVSTNQWVAEAALGRSVYARARRDDPTIKDWGRVEDLLRKLRDP